MKPTTEFIDALVRLEAALALSSGAKVLEGRQSAFNVVARETGAWPLAALILNYIPSSDPENAAHALRIIRATLDCYAPRRSVLDFDGEMKA